MLTYVIPVLAIVLLGAALRRMRRVPEGLFPAMEWFSFYVAFPALLFVGAARLKLSATDALDLARPDGLARQRHHGRVEQRELDA